MGDATIQPGASDTHHRPAHRSPMSERLGCRQVRRILQSFLDGELGEHDVELVAAHLESCTRCRVEADMYGRVIDAVRELRPDLDLAGYTRLVASVEDAMHPNGLRGDEPP